jgi:hypothetical protein
MEEVFVLCSFETVTRFGVSPEGRHMAEAWGWGGGGASNVESVA